MPTFLDPADRDAVVQRLRRVQPSAQALWGKLTAPRMVCHLVDSLRVGLGDATAERQDNLATRTIVKWLVVYSQVQPPKGRIETAPEFLVSAPTRFADDVAALEALIHRIGSTPTGARHPAFGPLTHDGWCRLSWKHVDHHLRQFGC